MKLVLTPDFEVDKCVLVSLNVIIPLYTLISITTRTIYDNKTTSNGDLEEEVTRLA